MLVIAFRVCVTSVRLFALTDEESLLVLEFRFFQAESRQSDCLIQVCNGFGFFALLLTHGAAHLVQRRELIERLRAALPLADRLTPHGRVAHDHLRRGESRG